MKNTILAWLIILVVTLSAVSFYNYLEQKNLLLKQMKSDSQDIADSMTAAIKRFHDIKSTINIQKLVHDMSLDLDIFEFRHLEANGVIRNSMFQDEIDKPYINESFKKVMQGDIKFREFFFEERDYVNVMAIYYPIELDNNLIGIMDLAVLLKENDLYKKHHQESELHDRKTDIINLLKAFEGSIKNSISIFKNANIKYFLDNYVKIARNILQVTIIDQNGLIIVSSNNSLSVKQFDLNTLKYNQIIEVDGRSIYRMLTERALLVDGQQRELMLLIDAAPYKKNKQTLLRTALITSVIALFIALFIARVIYNSAIKQSEEEKKRLEKLVKERTLEIEFLSKTDTLTGLWNRGYLEEMLTIEYERARRYEHHVSVAVIDLDYFKQVNDNYGHLAGDEVLRQISQKIKNSIRKTDFVGRYGGEEIVIIFPETDIKTAQTICNKIRQSIEKTSIIFESHTIKVTSSIGISSLQPEHKDSHAIFSEADEALYAAKDKGRNKVIVFHKKTPILITNAISS